MNHPGLTLVFQAIAFAGNRHDPRMVQQAVQQRRRQCRILREGGIPLTKRQISGDDQAALLVAYSNHLEEEIGLFMIHRQVPAIT